MEKARPGTWLEVGEVQAGQADMRSSLRTAPSPRKALPGQGLSLPQELGARRSRAQEPFQARSGKGGSEEDAGGGTAAPWGSSQAPGRRIAPALRPQLLPACCRDMERGSSGDRGCLGALEGGLSPSIPAELQLAGGGRELSASRCCRLQLPKCLHTHPTTAMGRAATARIHRDCDGGGRRRRRAEGGAQPSKAPACEGDPLLLAPSPGCQQMGSSPAATPRPAPRALR